MPIEILDKMKEISYINIDDGQEFKTHIKPFL